MKVGSLVGDMDGAATGGKQPTRLIVTLSIKKLTSLVVFMAEISANCTTTVAVAAGVMNE